MSTTACARMYSTGSAAGITGRGAGNLTGHHAHQEIDGAANRQRARTHLAPATASGSSALASAGGRAVGGAGSAGAAERQGELEDKNGPRGGGVQGGGGGGVVGGVKGGWGLGSIATVGASFGKRLLDALPDD